MIEISLSRPVRCAAAGLALLVVGGWNSPSQAQSVVLMVNGEPITGFDIEQRGKLDALSTHKTPPREQIINELIDDKVKLKEAKKYGIDPTASEVDAMYASMGARMRLNADQLTAVLGRQGVRPETMKSKMKADSVWASLIRGRYKDSLVVNEKDVNSAILVKGDENPENKDKATSFEYNMRPIVLVVPRGAAPGVLDARRKEAEALRSRIQSCDQATDIFRTMRDAAIRDNVVKTSADLPAPLREMLDKIEIGRLTPPEVTKQGVEMVALCSRKPTTADTPEKRELRDKMFVQKFEAKSKSYLQDLRKAAMIEKR
ncbi:SurA N-terminal domain-containing protein [Bradyrhizobium prioriisuperbiae]|uniref:SurA N-terminal domain-containing protein n=1 Tax=Bradyrhizobium prioriisuperbiae TaxID=2854389 RepID=UPI0028E36E92|nr:SurA N-terminal domain-containing protein [Bradyrhizobium prioritasuperba]